MAEQIYYININGKQQGPFSLQELEAAHITETTRIFKKGNPGFVNACDIPEIKDTYFSGNTNNNTSQKERPVVKDEFADLDMDKIRRAAAKEVDRRRQQEDIRIKSVQAITVTEQSTNDVPDINKKSVTPPPPAEPCEWYVANGDVQQGPMTMSELKAAGLNTDTKVWRADFPDWVNATDVPELSPFLTPVVIAATPQVGSIPPPYSPNARQSAAQPTVADVTETYNPYENIDYGHPSYAAVPAFILSLVVLGIAVYLVLSKDFLTTILFTPILPLIFSIAALSTSAMARSSYLKDRPDRALKLSGHASGYGIAALVFAALQGISLIIIYTNNYLYY